MRPSGAVDEHRPTESSAEASILVVDDYAANLTALTALLEPLGRPLITASSGEAALEELRRREFSVVILDVRMPGVSGLEVARRVRGLERNATVPIIFLTASEGDVSAAVEGYAAGAVDYVRKPFDPTILRSKIATFVELHERREHARREAAVRMQLEAERAAAARESRAKDEFLSVLSHELLTPLTSILLWTEMIARADLPSHTLKRGNQIIDRCARAEAHMLENVLEMSRIATGTFAVDSQPVDVLPLVGASIEEVRTVHESAPIAVINDGGDALRVRGDRQRLRQVVFNLVDNAVKFSSGPPAGEVAVAVAADQATVLVQVTDTGPGIPDDIRRRLFQPFRPGDSSHTRPHGGLGLGLAVAHAIAVAHGGSLDIAYRAGNRVGTVVTLRLPRA